MATGYLINLGGNGEVNAGLFILCATRRLQAGKCCVESKIFGQLMFFPAVRIDQA
jgi:hypothetical protein